MAQFLHGLASITNTKMPKVIKEKVKLNSFVKLNFLGTRNLDGDKHM